MARRSRDWNKGLAEDLRDPAFAREFLLAALDEGVPVQIALGKVIRAMGVREFAARIKMADSNLLRAINPSNIQPLQNEPALKSFLSDLGQFPLYGLILGIVITAIFQSSSAMMGLVLSLGINNLITLNAAIAMVLVANIGTCITGMLASIGSSLSSKRLALAQLVINIIGVLMFFPFIAYLSGLVAMMSTDLPRQIASAHTIFNVVVTAFILPLIGFLVSIVKRLLPGEEAQIKRGTGNTRLDFGKKRWPPR